MRSQVAHRHCRIPLSIGDALVAGTTEVDEAHSGVTLPECRRLRRRGLNSADVSRLAAASDVTALRLTDIDQRANRITGYTLTIDGGVPTEHVYGGLETAHRLHIDASVRGDRSLCQPASGIPKQRISYESHDFAQQLGVSGINAIRE